MIIILFPLATLEKYIMINSLLLLFLTEKSNDKEIPLLKLIIDLRGIVIKDTTILSNLGNMTITQEK